MSEAKESWKLGTQKHGYYGQAWFDWRCKVDKQTLNIFEITGN